MKNAPAILLASITLNVVLLGGLVMLWGGRQAATAPSAQNSVQVTQAAATARTPATAAPIHTAKAAPFRWQQLDAQDFPTFVKNLRAIGCPEPTVRDIVEGELREIYAQKLQQVAAGSRGALREAETLQLTTERERLLASLTAPAGTPATAAPLAVAATAVSSEQSGASSVATPPAPRIPVAFAAEGNAGAALVQSGGQVTLNTPAASPQLTSTETTMLQQVQSDFANALGDSAQSPDSPVYRQRWNSEVNRSNERYKALFGVNAYLRAEMQAARTGAAAQ